MLLQGKPEPRTILCHSISVYEINLRCKVGKKIVVILYGGEDMWKNYDLHCASVLMFLHLKCLLVWGKPDMFISQPPLLHRILPLAEYTLHGRCICAIELESNIVLRNIKQFYSL